MAEIFVLFGDAVAHERILVIIGGGRVPILSHAVDTSPEYVRVKVEDVLGPACGSTARSAEP